MTLQATIQDGAIWLSDARNNLEIQLTAWQQPHDCHLPDGLHSR